MTFVYIYVKNVRKILRVNKKKFSKSFMVSVDIWLMFDVWMIMNFLRLEDKKKNWGANDAPGFNRKEIKGIVPFEIMIRHDDKVMRFTALLLL